ncbi:MAG TPA: hypothetical protein VGL97_11400 [Bryobacteraceae bacterium]|jgi:hypothetical protein
MRAILTIFQHPVQREVEIEKRPRAIEPGAPAVSPNANVPATVESLILQRLLAELEARAVTRASTPYFVDPAVTSRRTVLVRTLFGLLWASSLVLCVFVVKYLDRQPTIQLADPAQTRSITGLTNTIGDQNKQFVRMIDSVEGLANAVAASSLRTSAMQAVLRRLGHDAKPADTPPARANTPVAAKSSPVAASMPIEAAQTEQSTDVYLGGHHHQPIEDVMAPRNVIVHHRENGVMDYWLVPRIVSGSRVMTKVFPIAQTNMGIFVHDLENVKDYIVTPTGDWLVASAPSGN